MKERPDVRHLPTSELLRTAVEAFMPKRAPYSMTVLWQREVLAELDRRIPPQLLHKERKHLRKLTKSSRERSLREDAS